MLLRYEPAAKGRKPRISTVPAAAIHGLRIRSRATTDGRSSAIRVGRRSGRSTITITGHLRTHSSGGVVQIAVNHPELVAATVFRSELARAGVTVAGPTTTMAGLPGYRQLVARDRSITLSQLLVPFLELSNNVHAETLTKTMGAVAVGGTLRYRMRGTRATGNVHAKTGSLTGVTALSGYVRAADGHRYAFSMISNCAGSSPRPVEDGLATTLARWRRP